MIKQSAMLLLPLILAAALLSGCTTVQEIALKNTFSLNDPPPPGGPAVILRPIRETMAADPKKAEPYQADPTFLGKGMTQIAGYGPVPILPFLLTYDEFHADDSRTAVVRAAVLSRLTALGIPTVDQSGTGSDQAGLPSGEHLGISLTLREFTVDTEYGRFLTLIITSGFIYNNKSAHVVLDGQLWQPGQTQPLWEGTVEGRSSTSEFKDGGQFQHSNVVGEAVFAAVDQFFKESGFAEARAKLITQRYDKLMSSGREQASAGESNQAMQTYAQASASALTPEQKRDAEEALWGVFTASAKRWLAATPRPAMSDEALTYKALARDASEREDFPAALQAYGKALEIHPMWPTGHYNAATLAAEAKDYKLAAYHMRRYLVLAPDAKDAAAAKEQFLLWQHKAKTES
jgi:hypothetical protein